MKKKPVKKAKVAKVKPIPAIHQWTHDGKEVLILKNLAKGGVAHGGFIWPLTVGATVEAPDWNPQPVCGGGLHGWAWGLGIGEGKDPDWSAVWLVFGALPSDTVDVEGKSKSKCGTIRFIGTWNQCTSFLLAGQMALVQARSSGAASNVGDSGAASNVGDSGAASNVGYRGAASNVGDRGAASNVGYRGAASNVGYSGAASNVGYSGAASNVGYSGAASNVGDRGAASNVGDSGAAFCIGIDSKAKTGKWGCLALQIYIVDHYEMRCAEVGIGDGSDGKLKADVWYQLDAKGAFVEVPQ